MSADLTIEATVITQTGADLTPVGIKLTGTGAIPEAALYEIAREALAVHTGSTEAGHNFRVGIEPTFHEKAEDTVTLFAVWETV